MFGRAQKFRSIPTDGLLNRKRLLQACVIAPAVWSARGAPSSFFPHRREGAERRLALLLSCTLRCACLCRHAASRRSTVASSTLGPSRRVRTRVFALVIQAAFAALHPDRTGLLAKAALRSKGEREPRATRTSVRVHSGAGATPAPPFRRLMMAPSHEQACRQYRVQGTAQ